MITLDGQGQQKFGLPMIVKGMIIACRAPLVPAGWALCDGNNGTPDLRGRALVGDTVFGTGTAGGTEEADAVTHSGFALGNHSDHTPTQPSAHSNHTPTQPATHTAHVVTQPATHPTHSSDGAHTHNAHTTIANASAAVTTDKLTGPGTHSSDGAHTHDAHPAHTGLNFTDGHTHSGFAVDAHSAHSGFAVDAHSAHSVTQADNHAYKVKELAYIMKL